MCIALQTTRQDDTASDPLPRHCQRRSTSSAWAMAAARKAPALTRRACVCALADLAGASETLPARDDFGHRLQSCRLRQVQALPGFCCCLNEVQRQTVIERCCFLRHWPGHRLGVTVGQKAQSEQGDLRSAAPLVSLCSLVCFAVWMYVNTPSGSTPSSPLAINISATAELTR